MRQHNNQTPNAYSKSGAVLGAVPGIITDSFLTTFGVASVWGYSEAVSLRDDEAHSFYWRTLMLTLTACSFTRQCSNIYYSEPNQEAQTTFQGGFFRAVGSPYSTLKRQFLTPSALTEEGIESYHSLQSMV